MVDDESGFMRMQRAHAVAQNMRADLAPEDEDDVMSVSSKAVLAWLVTEYIVKADLGLSASATLPEMLLALRRRLGIVTDRAALEEIVDRVPEQVTRWNRN